MHDNQTKKWQKTRLFFNLYNDVIFVYFPLELRNSSSVSIIALVGVEKLRLHWVGWNFFGPAYFDWKWQSWKRRKERKISVLMFGIF